MTNSKSTKRALVTSALSVFLCITMLIGTTFAWFTDTASTSVNKIQAGTLKVDLQVKENGAWVSAEGKILDFVKAAGHENESILWEPGCTYNLPELRVVNEGNLALKYKVVITGINGDAKLNKAIEWTGLPTDSKLAAKEEGKAFTISGTMIKAAGNAYQGLTIEGISITVYATQDTVESDSNNDQYDKDATYAPIANVTALADKKVSVKLNGSSNAEQKTLDTAYVFNTTETSATNSNYAKYHADFVISVDKDVAANSVMLAGYYDAFCTDGNWIGMTSSTDVKVGDEIRLLKSMYGDNISINYEELCDWVKEFKCGAVDLNGTNVGTTLKVELRLYEIDMNANSTSSVDCETGDYIVIGSYSYTF